MGIAATNIPISAGTTDYVSAINAAVAATGNFDRVLNSQLAASFRSLDRESRVFESGLGRVQRILNQQAAEAARSAAAAQAAAARRINDIGNGFQSVGQKMTTYITAPLALIAGLGFRAYASIDGMVKGLKAATGSAEEANKQFQEFYQISKNPGLGLDQTVQAGLQLETLGFQAQTAKKYVAEVGNAIALGGKGKVEFGSVMTQFTQMAGKARVLSEDLKPIVTASPVIAKAIQNIFSSVDSETISGKLQAAGKGPKDFIELLVNELSKLERVEGGPLNALENFGDGASIAAYNVVGAADKIFGITDKINAVGSVISGAAEGFIKLPESTQQAILGLTGLAAAIGPVSLGIGTVIKLLPVLKVGFATLTGPIGLTVAAIVAGAALIIANWDSVKATLQETGIYSQLVSAAQSALETVSGLFNLAKTVILYVWDELKNGIIATTRFVFDTVASIVRGAIGIIGGVFKVLTGVLTLNWDKFAEGFQNITASILNVVRDLFLNSFIFIGRLFAEFLSKYGFGDAAKGINGYLDSVNKRAAAATIALKGVKSVSDGIALNEVTVKAKRSATAGVGIDFAGKGDSAIKQATDKLKELKEAIRSANLAGQDSRALQAEYDALKDKIDAASASTTKHKEAVQKTYSVLDVLKRSFKAIKAEIAEKQSLNITVPAETFHLLDQTEAQIDRLTGKIQKSQFLNPNQDAFQKQFFDKASERRAGLSAGATNRANDELPGLSTQRMPEQFSQVVQQIRSAQESIVETYRTLRDTVKNAASNTAIEMSTGFGEVLGGIATGQTSLFNGVISLAVDFLSNYLAQIGRANIAAGAALIAAGALTLNPFMIAQGKQKVTGGTLLQVASGAVKVIGGALANSGGMKKFAKGGVFDRTSVGIFGEYAGATMNREIATPERLMASVFRSELDNYGPRVGGGGNVPARIQIDVTGKIRAKDLNLAGTRYVETQKSFT